MGALKSPQKIREIPFRFSKRRYLRPLAAPVASYRVLRRLGTFLWPTIVWNGAWHFTRMGDVAAVNLKIVSDSHADESTEMTEAEFNACLSQLVKTPLQELPLTIQQNRYAHLIA